MYRHILVPVDGSKLGERALVLAVPLADQHNATLTLLSVHEPIADIILGGGAPVRDPALDHTWRQDHRDYLDKLAKRVGRRASSPVKTAFVDGRIVPSIAKYAAEHAVDLIVMCTHGRGGFQRFWLGSVADGLARTSSVPLLLARGGRSPGTRLETDGLFRRIMVPLDGSDRSETALKTVKALVGKDRAAITLAHVIHPMSAAAVANLAPRPEYDPQFSYLAPLAAQHRSPTITIDHDMRTSANVVKALLEIADAHDAELIAITSQGMGGLQRMIVGSVADKLIRTARVPVLLCPTPAK